MSDRPSKEFFTDPRTGAVYVRESLDQEWQLYAPPPTFFPSNNMQVDPAPQSYNPNVAQFDSVTHSQPPGGPSGNPFPAPTKHVPIDPLLQDQDETTNLTPSGFPRPVVKTAGSRRPSSKTKGKQRADDEQPATTQGTKWKGDHSDPTPKKRGRTPGTVNYSAEDLKTLMDILEIVLPLGQKGWNEVAAQFEAWATETRRAVRSASSLENKYKSLVRTTKPTGEGVCPPHIERAHEIEYLINERAGTRDLNDSDIADKLDEDVTSAISISSDDDAEAENVASQPRKSAKVKSEPGTLGPVARRNFLGRLEVPGATPVAPRSRTSRNTPMELLGSISRSFAPDVRSARDEERATRSFQTTQFLSMSSQIRDLQTSNNELRNRLLDMERERSASERRADRAELSLEMERLARGRRVERMESPPRRRMESPPKRMRVETRYRDGGASRVWMDEHELHLIRDDDDGILSREMFTDEAPTPQSIRSTNQPQASRAYSSSSARYDLGLAYMPGRYRRTGPSNARASSSHTTLDTLSRTPRRDDSADGISIIVTPHRSLRNDTNNVDGTPLSGWGEPTPSCQA